jgi:hypothetical protein
LPLAPDLLTRYCEKFVGYGALDGTLWFIGMEEGGGGSRELLEKRMAIWGELGGTPTMDVKSFHEKLGDGADLFSQRPRLQRTWNKLIEAYFAARGLPSHREARREFQAKRLGRSNADHCLLELMPLPSPTSSGRHIDRHDTGIPWLESRPLYVARWRSHREGLIKDLIRKHKPRAVVMYGASHLRSWHTISGHCLSQLVDSSVHHGQHRGVSFFALPHPRRSTLDQWRKVGTAARKALRVRP